MYSIADRVAFDTWPEIVATGKSRTCISTAVNESWNEWWESLLPSGQDVGYVMEN